VDAIGGRRLSYSNVKNISILTCVTFVKATSCWAAIVNIKFELMLIEL